VRGAFQGMAGRTRDGSELTFLTNWAKGNLENWKDATDYIVSGTSAI